MNPYAAPLGDLDPVVALAETPARVKTLVTGMAPAQLQASYSPGKWNTSQILLHLVQVELAVGFRLRMALTEAHHVVQPFDQDLWMARETGLDAETALAAYLGLRKVNLRLVQSLTPADREKAFTHPERGLLDVNWLLVMLAGHERHHLPQLEAIAAGPTSY
jgi:hypothetical protein